VYIPYVVCCGIWSVAHLRANLLPPLGRCVQHGDSKMLRSLGRCGNAWNSFCVRLVLAPRKVACMPERTLACFVRTVTLALRCRSAHSTALSISCVGY